MLLTIGGPRRVHSSFLADPAAPDSRDGRRVDERLARAAARMRLLPDDHDANVAQEPDRRGPRVQW